MDERRNFSGARQSATDISRAQFKVARKGFDTSEVRSYLDGVAREMATLEARLDDLQNELADALKRAANPVLDEATLAGALGAQSAAILRQAHDEAGRVSAEAQERAAAIFAQAQERGSRYLLRGSTARRGRRRRSRGHGEPG
jgi:DivIVA domain-containing protein